MPGSTIMNIVASDMSPSAAPAMNEWYDEVHIPALMDIGEISRVRRLRRVGFDEPYDPISEYLTLYEFADAESYGRHHANPFYKSNSPALRPTLNSPSDASLHANVVFEQIFSSEGHPDEAAEGGAGNRIVTVTGAEVSEDFDAPFMKWYHEVHIPDLLESGLVLRARRFRRTSQAEGFSGISKYITMYEFSDWTTYTRYNALPAHGTAAGQVADLPGFTPHGTRMATRSQFELMREWNRG